MGSVGGNTSNTVSYEQQTFKLTSSRFGKTEYESELFRIRKYSHSPSASLTVGGYVLEIKGQHTPHRPWFSKLAEAKDYVNTPDGKDWYEKNRRK